MLVGMEGRILLGDEDGSFFFLIVSPSSSEIRSMVSRVEGIVAVEVVRGVSTAIKIRG
jgi:hypothetical protein